MEDYDPAAEDIYSEVNETKDCKDTAEFPLPIFGQVNYDREKEGEA